MLSIINSSNLIGIESFIVKVEVDISNGIPSFMIVGLPSTEIKESRERVKSAILNSGYKFPGARIVVNLSPADLKKEGVFLDLAIAIGILKSSIDIDDQYLRESLFIGEISLDGKIKKVRGILPMLSEIKDDKIKRVFIPYDNRKESTYVKDIEIIPIETLNECVEVLISKNYDKIKWKLNKNKNIVLVQNKKENLDLENKNMYLENKNTGLNGNKQQVEDEKIYEFEEDFSDIKGNYYIKRSAEICAAGNHNMLMIGPPGSGKTMLAKRIITILPDIKIDEMLEVSKIYSILGMIDENKGIIDKRPFRSPHHTTTKISLVGGGIDARPGEVTLAHRGILFLDEIAEFDRRILESLRQPIEDKYINISRLKNTIKYPCNVLLIAAMNPCPCGFFGDDKNLCRCSPRDVARYTSKLSGPLLDRFDIFIEVNQVAYEDLNDRTKGESSLEIKKRVSKARDIQKKRFIGTDIKTNSEIKSHQLLDFCKLSESGEKVLKKLFNKYNLSNRSYKKMVTTARTIADLEEKDFIDENDILEAFSYRKAYYEYFKKMY